MRLQLSVTHDMEWLTAFWQLHAGIAQLRRMPSKAEPANTSGKWQLKNKDALDVPTESAANSRENSPENSPVSLLQREPNTIAMKVSHMSSGNSSSSFADTGECVPLAEAPGAEPAQTEQLETLTLEKAREALENEDCLPRFLRENVNAFELTTTPWSESKRISGTLVRKSTFKMALPTDIPHFLQRLIAMPQNSSVTTVYCLRASPEQLILTFQTCTHDVTFGENFRVKETLAFEGLPAGGVKVKQWIEVVWLEPLPWTHSAIQSYIENRSVGESKRALPVLVGILKELGG